MNVLNQEVNDNYSLYHGDSVEIIKGIPDNSIHYSIFSPPFASLYTYSNSERDMGNSKTRDEFYEHFNFLISELFRVTMSGRLLSFHCMNLPTFITHDGYIGIKDFRGDLIRLFQASGWSYHSEVVIWKDPLLAATRTKAIGLMHKQLCKDSAISRNGIPDYLVTMRKIGENPEPINHGRGFERYVGEGEINELKHDDPQKNKYSHHVWRKYASPIWMDIRATRTLQASVARDGNDERHICPLQLDVIERCIELWSNPGDVILSPFAGIGSEGAVSIETGRKFIGIELKESYYNQAVKNLNAAVQKKDNQFVMEF
ncbi:MAG TPA: site-specific DNA-methyltransferase [bacterium]|nr:site-specific DNA-methyltransferase [bacterium]